VLCRFYHCAKEYTPKIIVRATCDNPCVDWMLADHLINAIGEKDYISGFGAPIGTSLEVFKSDALFKAYLEANDPISQEHVTPYIYKNPQLFKFGKIPYYLKLDRKFRLTVDTKEDMELINNIYSHLYHGYPMLNEQIYEYLNNHLELLEINQNVQQNII